MRDASPEAYKARKIAEQAALDALVRDGQRFRYCLLIEYDGTPFVGWQRQKDGLGVQHALEEAFAAIGEVDCIVEGAGRTDAGVHALGQVAHVDLRRNYEPERLLGRLNHHLRDVQVSVLGVTRAASDFHARFSALSRAYVYRIIDRRGPLTLERERAAWSPVALDVGTMQEAAASLLGRHDFSSYRAIACQAKNPVRTLDRLEVTRKGPEICVDVEARSFLHQQVRIVVGSLIWVGQGKWKPGRLREVLAMKDRHQAGPAAPAHGLYLTKVHYPDE